MILFIFKLSFNKKQPNLLHWKVQSKLTLLSISISLKNNKPISQKCFEHYLPNLTFTWWDVYILTRMVTINTRLRVFQYKVLNSALSINKHLYIFKRSDTKLCSFCNREDEIIIHFLLTARKTKHYRIAWKGFLKTSNAIKCHLYVSRCCETNSFAALKGNIKRTHIPEKGLSFQNTQDEVLYRGAKNYKEKQTSIYCHQISVYNKQNHQPYPS